MRGTVSLLLLAGLALAGGAARAAQADSEPVSALPRPALQAREAAVTPVLDGDVLGDIAWDGVPPPPASFRPRPTRERLPASAQRCASSMTIDFSMWA
ncbi:MAG: hypothetical protein O7A07_09425 [Acidobacteria bacterium]|nr:hypothetical protein [Acidobacteriota bacterium]